MTNPGAGMPCPVCKVPLVMSDRQGVEIDYCPQCRGVWLDRGELDKILERSVADTVRVEAPRAQEQRPSCDRQERDYKYDRDDKYDRDHKYSRYGHGKRRKSFLEELFD